jgi:hypothetical protein
MNRHFTRYSVCLACAVCTIMTFVPWASASPLLSGQALFAVPEPDPIGGITIAGGVPVPFATGNLNGTLTSSVIAGDVSNPLGGLTFTYLLQNNAAAIDDIGRLTVNNFAGWLTDVSFQAAAVGVPPLSNDRSPGLGDVMGFTFSSLGGGPGPVPPGQSSMLLVVQTNAPQFTQTFASVIDGSVASVPSFSPIPEPATLSLLILGGLAMIRRRR